MQDHSSSPSASPTKPQGSAPEGIDASNESLEKPQITGQEGEGGEGSKRDISQELLTTNEPSPSMGNVPAQGGFLDSSDDEDTPNDSKAVPLDNDNGVPSSICMNTPSGLPLAQLGGGGRKAGKGQEGSGNVEQVEKDNGGGSLLITSMGTIIPRSHLADKDA